MVLTYMYCDGILPKIFEMDFVGVGEYQIRRMTLKNGTF